MPSCLPSVLRCSPSHPHFARPAIGRAFVAIFLLTLLFLLPSPASAQSPSGAGSALYFDGVDDYVQIPDHTSLDFGSGNFTVELWVQRLNAGVRTDLLERNNGAGNALAIYVGADNLVHFDTTQSGAASTLTSTTAVGTGWTHIACVRNFTRMTIYINGKHSGEATPTRRNFDSDSPIRLGKNMFNELYWLHGSMDELRIWRSARTQSEILQNMYRPLPSVSGLVLYYSFEGLSIEDRLPDLSSNGNYADLFNFSDSPHPWRASGAFSGPGNALRFDGSNDAVSVSNSTLLQPAEYTVEAWINRNPFSTTVRTILRKGSSEPYQLSLDPTNGKVSFLLFNGTTRQTVTSQSTFITSRWYHLAATYSTADGGSMKLYVNGVLEGSLTGVGTPVTNTNPLTIGGGSYTGAGYFDGLIDEVRIWSCTRTADEIRETMARTLTGSEPNLAAYYRFDQSRVANVDDPNLSRVNDWGPSGLQGYLMGFTVIDATWPASSAFNTWVGGVSADWASAANWSRNTVPVSSDTVGVPGGSTFSPTFSANVAVRDLVIGSGSVLTAAGAPTFTVGGNWFNQGTFVPDSSTVLLNGSNQALAGSTTFNHLTKTTVSSDTLTFPAGQTQTVTGNLTLKGSGANRLALRSSQPGAQWMIDPQGARDIASLDVQDSNNTNAAAILIGEADILDSGNNTGWAFGSPPVITEGESISVTMSEDGDPIPFSLSLHATDPDGDDLTWSLAAPPLHGTANAAGTGECLEVGYIPHTGYSGTDSFVVAVSDNRHGSDSITADVTIQAVDDPPVLTLPTGTLAYTEGDGAVAVAPDLTLTDPDGPNLTGVRVSIEGYQSGEDFLDYTTTNGITGSFDAGTGVLELTGSYPVSDYQAALRAVKYRNASQTPSTAPRTIAFSITQASLYFPVTQHFYEFVSAPNITWTDARTRAENKASYGAAGYPSGVYGMQGYLATIISAEENAFLTDKVAGSAWIGANDATAEGVWRWVTGPEAGTQFWSGAAAGLPVGGRYTNWNNLEPNDSGGNEDYAHMMSWTVPPGKWNDLPNAGGTGQYASTGYMVEYGGMPGDPFLSLSGQVTVNVSPSNDSPVFTGSSAVTLNEDGLSTIDLAPRFTDADGDPISFAMKTGPANGSGSITGTNLTYTPASNFNGSDSLTVTASDGNGGTLDVTFSYTINPVNDAPTSANNTVTTLEDTPYVFAPDDFPFNDVDSGDSLRMIQITTLPGAGALLVSGDAASEGQTFPISALDLGSVVFQPAANANGDGYASFTFRVSDQDLAFSGVFTLTVDVTAMNDDAPTSASKTITIDEDTDYIFSKGDFHFADADIGDSLQLVQIRTLPEFGSLTVYGSAALATQIFSVEDLNAGCLVFHPAENANGAAYASFNFRVSDGGNFSDVYTLTIHVTAVNDAPQIGTNPQNKTLAEDNSYQADLSLDVSDVDGDTLTYNVTDPADHGSAVMTGSSLIYTPDADYNGSDSFQVTVTDGHGGVLVITFNVTITAVNDSPTFSGANPTWIIVDEDDSYTSADLLPLFSDVDGDTLSFEITTAPANGSADLVTSGTPAQTALTYAPSADFNGSDSLTVTATDGNGGSLAVVFNFTVFPTHDAPTSADITVTIAEDTLYVFSEDDFYFADADAGDALNFVQIATLPGAGTLFVDGNRNDAADAGESVSADQMIDVSLLRDIKFRPALNAHGAPYTTFDFRVSDGGLASDDHTVTINVTSVNDPPVFSGSTSTTLQEDGFKDVDLAPLFSDADGDPLTYEISTGPTNGGAGIGGTTLTYTPDSDYHGSDSLTVTASDGKGGSLAVVFNFTVTAVNDAPDSADNTVTTQEDTPYVFSPADFSFADVDTGDALHSVTIRSLPAAGSLVLDGAAVSAGDTIPVADLNAGRLAFQPAANAHGSPYAAFDFRVSDGDDSSGDYTLTIDVASVNDAPVFECGPVLDFYLNEDSQLNHYFAGCFSDPDGDALTISVTTDPVHGSAAVGTFLVYTPDANFHGDDSATVTAMDGSGGARSVTFHFHVLSKNDAPTSADRTVTIAEDALYVFSAADFSFADVDGDTLHSVLVGLPGAGTLFLDANDNDAVDAGEAVTAAQTVDAADISRLKFAPQADASGDPYTTFEFQVSDGIEFSSPANTLTIRVTAANDAPEISGTPGTTVAAESAYSFTPTASDTDGDPLTFSIANKPAWASFDTATGALTGTPANADAGTITGIVISVSDGQGGSASLPAFDLTVTFTNHPPVVTGPIPAQKAAVGEAFAYTVPGALFTDPDAQDLLVTAVLADGSDLPVWLAFDAESRRFSGTPGAGDAGTLFVTLIAADPYGAQVRVTFSLTVESADNNSPLLAQPVLDQYGSVGKPFAFELPEGTFFDPDGDPAHVHAQLAGGQPLPAWLSFDGEMMVFTGTPPEPGVWPILLTAYDGLGGTASTTFDLIVPEGNSSPYLQKLIPDRTAIAGTAFTFTLDHHTFVDPDGDPIVYGAQLASGGPLPDWLRFDPETLTFRGTPPAGQSGVLLVRVFVVEMLLEDLAAADVQEGPANDLFLIGISDAENAYLPANITGLQTSFGQAQLTLPAGLLPVHPHYALKIETIVTAPNKPAGWVSLKRDRRVTVVDSNGDPVAGGGSASICFPLSAGDWVLGNGEARSFAVASAASAAGSWRMLETLTDADRRTVCAEVPFGLVGLFVPAQPDPAPADELPATGFAPGRVTPLPAQSAEDTYDRLGSLWIEIPRLGVQAEIVGVPYRDDRAWDVTWLGARAGWLESTAFPTWAGNSVLAAHATSAFGLPGPFARLGELRYGDRIVVHLFGQRYVYEVRSVDAFTAPDDTRTMRHEELPWLTLVTCRGYDEATGEYRWRTVVRAVQVGIEE